MNESYQRKNQYQTKYLGIAALIAAVAIGGYLILNAPDQRTGGEKIGDAIDELDQGFGKAARQLEDRTPGEKLGDVIKDAGDDAKKATNQ